LKLGFGLLLFVSLFSSLATTFSPIPLEYRIDDAKGVVQGRFLGQVYKKLPDGNVVTEVSIGLDKAVGFYANEILNRSEFKVILPGGVWNGHVYKVQGVPHFKKGEEVVLMITKGKFGFYLPNMAMSKFQVKRVRHDTTLVSEIFSEKEGVGRIELKDFESLLSRKFGKGLEKVDFDRVIYRRPISENLKKSRKPASIELDDENEDISPWSGMALVLTLTALSFFSIVLSRRGKEK
jgi:hypothetical protein